MELPSTPLVYFGISVFGICYLAFCVYLILHVIVSMGGTWVESNVVCTVSSKENIRHLVGVTNDNVPLFLDCTEIHTGTRTKDTAESSWGELWVWRST